MRGGRRLEKGKVIEEGRRLEKGKVVGEGRGKEREKGGERISTGLANIHNLFVHSCSENIP